MGFKSDTVAISHDISVVYTPAAGQNIITLIDNNPNQIRNKFGSGNVPGVANGLLDELRCYASISSLPDVNFPDITNDDPESVKVVKAQTFEWETARFELVVYKKAKDSADWAEFGVSALKNAGGFRYRIHRILDLITDNIGGRVGEWGRIGVAVRSVGYGYPQSFDRITFTGHWVQEFTWVEEYPTYVQINQYGASASPSPTPTPVAIPALTLSLASGNSAIANNDEKINLAIANIPANTNLSGTWFRNGIDTGVAETITNTGNPIQLSTLKLRDKFSGNYSLRLFYNSNGYTPNEVAVTVNPEVILSLPSGVSSASTGAGTAIAVTGKYFDKASITYTYTWLRGGVVVNTASPGSKTLAVANGSFSFNVSASELQSSTSGDYQLRVNIVEGSATVPYLSKNTVTVAITAPVTVAITPSSANLWNGATYTHTIVLSNFVSGSVLSTIWQKDGVDLPSTAETRTYTPTNNQMSYTKPGSFIYPNNAIGLYRIKITTADGAIFYSNTCNVENYNAAGGFG